MKSSTSLSICLFKESCRHLFFFLLFFCISSDSGGGRKGRLNLMPETYEDANTPLAGTEAAAAAKASALAGKQPAVMMALSLSAVCTKASMVLINDYEGQGIPVLDFSLRDVGDLFTAVAIGSNGDWLNFDFEC